METRRFHDFQKTTESTTMLTVNISHLTNFSPRFSLLIKFTDFDTVILPSQLKGDREKERTQGRCKPILPMYNVEGEAKNP